MKLRNSDTTSTSWSAHPSAAINSLAISRSPEGTGWRGDFNGEKKAIFIV
ncbi:hypothetical protein WH297_24070 [Ochrobactrum vermis]|uniref:Uncharacterized protein n=1 Tax=Ochrobactrum vermis TaxID=1827297 RepID=A0ABU8PKL0_9HYPH